MDKDLHVVTGAFGYSGGYIASRLLAAGCRVRTLTNSPSRTSQLQGKIEAHPFNFHNVDKLASSLVGASVLYNTYWVRFNAGSFSHADAVRNTLTLFTAAKRAGVSRVVHISITNPSPSSPLEYFRGKAQLEEALKATGISHAILRPAVLFGPEDILINNIAWMLRRFPVFPIFGDGRYRLQPIYVDDLAMRAVEFGAARENVVVDAVGPETFTYREMVKMLGRAIGKPRPTVSVPPGLGQLFGGVLGALVKDRVITREEIRGLMLDLLYTTSAPLGATRLSDWAWAMSATLGLHYASELRRRNDRMAAYSGA